MNFRPFFLILLVLGWSCDTKPSESSNHSLEIKDSITKEVETPFDPDPTDQISGDQYLVDASEAKTASMVRERLTQLFSEDLKIGIVDSLSRKFIFFEFDLDGDDRKEIFVGTTGPYFCGTGGCTQFILNSQGEVISMFTVSDYPVVISLDKTNGWYDLFILSGGEFRVVKFDGKAYPKNPSILPKLGTLPGDGLPRVLDFVNDNYPWFRF